jgi:hypothetical protein
MLLVRLGILMGILGVAAVCIVVSPLGSMIGSMFSVARDDKRLKTRDDAPVVLSHSWKPNAAPSSFGPIPNSELPSHIKSSVDSVALFADFGHPGTGGIPLYFINGKQADQPLSYQDGDFYVKLEYQDEAGKWVRAQEHQFSFCGNSYGGTTVPPGMHRQFAGYTPRDGKTAKVRYKMYSPPWVVSNEGVGVVSMADVMHAAKDKLAVQWLPGIFSDAFNERSQGLTPSQRVSALELLGAFGKAPNVRESAKALADRWNSAQESTTEQKKAAEEIHRLLSKPEPEDQSVDRLVRACWEQINRQSTGINASLVPWLACGQLSQTFFSEGRRESPESGILSDLTPWAALTRHAARLYPNADESTRVLIESLLEADFLVDSFLTREDLVKLLNTTENATYIASCAFARRNEWEWLAEQAMGFRAEFKPKVLLALASRGRNAEIMRSRGRWIPSLPPKDSAQEKLWKDVSGSDPAKVAFLFYYWAEESAGGTINFGPIITDAIRRHLQKEIGRTEEFLMPPLDVTQYEVRYLSLANDAQDIPLLQELLAHGGYVTSASTSYGPGNEKREYTTLCYGIRLVTAQMLEARGVKVPPDLVVSKEISDSGTKVSTFSKYSRR